MFFAYCTWENFGGGKFWQIWRIIGDLPNFYPPNIQFDKSVLCDYRYPWNMSDDCTSLHNCNGGRITRISWLPFTALVIHRHRQHPKYFDILAPWLVQRTRDSSSNIDSCNKYVGKHE